MTHLWCDDDGQAVCNGCGTRADLDDLGACSTKCDRKIETRFVLAGHNHGPIDPPENCEVCFP
jgi:hypothetical protein